MCEDVCPGVLASFWVCGSGLFRWAEWVGQKKENIFSVPRNKESPWLFIHLCFCHNQVFHGWLEKRVAIGDNMILITVESHWGSVPDFQTHHPIESKEMSLNHIQFFLNWIKSWLYKIILNNYTSFALSCIFHYIRHDCQNNHSWSVMSSCQDAVLGIDDGSAVTHFLQWLLGSMVTLSKTKCTYVEGIIRIDFCFRWKNHTNSNMKCFKFGIRIKSQNSSILQNFCLLKNLSHLA